MPKKIHLNFQWDCVKCYFVSCFGYPLNLFVVFFLVRLVDGINKEKKLLSRKEKRIVQT